MALTRSKVFVDTGGWISFVVQRDRYHVAAADYYSAALAAGVLPLTSDYVLDETLTRLRYDYGHAAAMGFWRLISQARKASLLGVLQVDETIWREARQ